MQPIKSDSMSPHACAFLTSLLALLLVSCAGGSAKVGQQYSGGKSLPRPPVVVIYQCIVRCSDLPSYDHNIWWCDVFAMRHCLV